MTEQPEQHLVAVLNELTGRPVLKREIVDALGMSRSAYYLQRDEGRLVRPDNIVRLARAMGVNPVDLMLRAGVITDDEVRGAFATARRAMPGTRRRRIALPTIHPRPDVPPV